MITINSIKNSRGAAAAYYAKEDNYYLSEVDAKEASLWWGKSAAALGLNGKVKETELQQLLEGKLPNGEIIGLKKDGKIIHRPGYDLCFHAPKSVSILALDGEDARFYGAHLEAVKESLAIIEQDCAQTKGVEGGGVRFKDTKNIAAALICHTASRKLDPHLHHHALVMNITQRSDGSWRSLASSKAKTDGIINGFSERVYKNQIYYGVIYQSLLASKIVQMGYEIETVGAHGLWEIKGVPKEAREIMSKRRNEIENKAEELSYSTKKAMDIISLATRDKKPKSMDLDSIKKVRREELASVGFSSKALINRTEYNKHLGSLGRVIPEVSREAKETINDAVAHLSQYNLRLDYPKIVAQALEFSMGNVRHGNVVTALESQIREGKLIAVDKAKSLFVTKEIIDTEKAVMDIVTSGKAANTSILLKDKVIGSIDAGEVKDQAISILQSSNRLSLVESKQSDNAEFLSVILKLAEASSKTVRILSPNRMMSNDINEDIKRKPNNLWQWLRSLGKPEVGETVAGFKHKYQEEIDQSFIRFKQNKDVIVINNAETLGCGDLHELLTLTEKTNAKVVFLQDSNAKQGFSAGNSITTLKQAGIDTFKLAKEANKIHYIPELKAIKDKDERIKQLARTYALKEDPERNNTVVFLGSKEQCGATNKAIREELKHLGKLSSIERTISVLNPTYLSKPEATLAHKYQQNMVIRIYDDNRRYQDWSIESVNREQNTVRLVQNNNRIVWNPKKQKINYMLFKQDQLQLAGGDKLIATGNMGDFGIKNGTRLAVKEINDKEIKLAFGTKTVRIKLSELRNSHFQYDYTTTLSRYSKKQAEHVLADIKAYSLDKLTMNELTSRAKESLIIFTDNADTAQKRLDNTKIKLTATEVVLDASQIVSIDRLVSDKTTAEIKADISKAITVLDEQYKFDEKAELKAVNFAIEKIASRNAGFTHKELVTEALTYALKEQIAIHGAVVTHEDIMKVIIEKRDVGELVMGRHFEDGTRWTTKEILALEKAIVADIKTGQDKVEPFLEPKTAKVLLENTYLTQDQKEACHLITTTKDQFVIIQGYAGTGKTTMFAHVQNMLKETEGEAAEILALAPTHRAVKELKSIGVDAQTLKSFLVEQQQDTDKSDANSGNKLDNKLIILDEASMVSNEEFANFLEIVGKSQGHVVLSGDIAQHISIGSGKPFEIIQRSNILKTSYLREIVRQKNLNLKEAVEDVISGDYRAAFQKIGKENPQHHVPRVIATSLDGKTGETEQQSFFTTLNNSIVEIDNNKLKAGEKTLEQMVAEDFLSRTPEARDKTVVIVHANADRKVITDIIRDGLKEQGVIAKQGAEVSCLVSKGLTDTEHKSLQNYNVGDVVKLGKEYYHVAEKDKEAKGLLLKDVEGKTKFFYPEKYAGRYNLELYEHTKAELAAGDIIRFTKTDKERGLFANFEYKVKETNSNSVVLESKDASAKSSQAVINPKDSIKDAHWDYAQTVTGYGIQGGSKKYAIDVELSYRKNLANQRSFYIGASRAVEHLIVYTDDKNRLLHRILANKGDKYAALEVTGEIAASNNNIGAKKQDNDSAESKKNTQKQTDFVTYDAKEIAKSLSDSAEVFVERLLGRPNEKLSSTSEWRYGRKGSLAINMRDDKRGVWHNFETGESGDLLTLIQKETGQSFKEALKYASDLVGGNTHLLANNQHKNSGKDVVLDNKSLNKTDSKTKIYAQQLAAESKPINGTIVEKYLKNRGIKEVKSDDIRYHPKVYTGKNEKHTYLPAMLSIGRDNEGNVQCVQATYLDSKTSNKADIDVKKRTYASPSGTSVSLQSREFNNKKPSKNDITFIAEGVETGLSIKEAVNDKQVLVTLGKSNFTSIDFTKIGQKVVLCLDNDGPASLTDSVIHKAAQRLIDAGKDVFVSLPNQINRGDSNKTDFNDIAKNQGTMAVKKYLDNAVSYTDFNKKIEQNQINNSTKAPLLPAKNVDGITKNIHEISTNKANKSHEISNNNAQPNINISQIKSPKSMNFDLEI